MASGTFTGNDNGQCQCKISWSSSAGTGGSTVWANLIAQNINDWYFHANVYYGYNLNINESNVSGSGGALSSAINGAVTLLSHSAWVGYTGNKSISISGSINLTGILNGGTISCSGTAELDKVGSAPSTPSMKTPSTQIVSETSSSILVQWNASSSYNNTGNYILQVSQSGGAWKDVKNNIAWGTLSYTYSIPSKTQGTSYKFRVAAKNDVGTSGYSESGTVTLNKLNAPTIGTLNTYNPFVTSTLTVPLSGGSQTNGNTQFTRRADLYYGSTWLASCATPSNGNTSVTISYSANNFVSKLGKTAYSSNNFRIVAWIQNSNGSRSAYVEKYFTVNINSDGKAIPTLGAPTISGGAFSLPASCFIAGISTLNVTSGTGTVQRGGSVGVTLTYKISVTGYSDKSGTSASYTSLTAGVKTVKVTVTDSRGLSTSQTKQIRVQTYAAPTIKNLTGSRATTPETNAVLTYTLSYSPIYQYSTNVNTPGTQLNNISLQQYSLDGSKWVNYTSGSTIMGLDTEKVYTIQIRVADKVRTTTYTKDSTIIPSINVGLALRKKRIGINCVPQEEYALEVKGATYLNGTVTTGGKVTANALIDAKKDVQIHYDVSTVDGSSPFAGAITETALTNLKNKKTVLGSMQLSSTWYNLISVRHRNGNEDGTNYGMYLKSSLTSSGSLTWGKQYGSTSWQAERTILDSGNYKAYLLNAFPVGAIYITTTNTNPSTFLGGTWTQFAQGRTLVGAGQGNDGTTSMSFTALATGGEYKHELTVAEMPDHRHKYTLAYGGADPARGFSYGNTVAGTFDATFIQNNGSNSAHNNVQPYISVYFWQRTA